MVSGLDIFLLSEGLVNGGGDLTVMVLPSIMSDHWPVFLSWDGMGPPIKKLFHFEKFWLQNKDFKSLV